MAAEVVIDKKGRIVIPRHLRERLKLYAGGKVKLVLEEGKIAIVKSVIPKDFVKELEGFVKEGSPIPEIDPLELKKIWERS